MPAYVISEISIRDHEAIVEYQKLVPATLVEFQGKFVARGGQIINLEGEWKPERVVITEFPTLEQAKAWYNSENYTKARQIRHKAASTRMIIVEGTKA
jgi:uncharacterized protein (DUF1330 family)